MTPLSATAPGPEDAVAPEQGQPFQDLRAREQQALELNDAVLQGLVVAKMALELDQPRRANEALSASIESASRIITDLLGSSHASLDLLRSAPAAAGGPDAVAKPGEAAADVQPARASQ